MVTEPRAVTVAALVAARFGLACLAMRVTPKWLSDAVRNLMYVLYSVSNGRSS